MKILALEFSSPQRSVAVASLDRRDELAESETPPVAALMGTHLPRPSQVSVSEVIETARGHSTKPLGMVEAALKGAGLEREQIECIVVGLGPGSYTGIRVAIALAQGWQLATGVKLLGISSAESIATQAQADGFSGQACVVIDAQREEFYVASYELAAMEHREISPLRLAALSEVRERERAGETLIGPEVMRWFSGARVAFPQAAAMARLALRRSDFDAGEDLSPIYLRETSFVKAPLPRNIT